MKICQLCPPGHECPNPANAPVPCQTGYYKVGQGSGSCAQCSPNSACPFTDQAPYSCPTGYESAAGQTSCKPTDSTSSCSSGQFAYPNANDCTDCPIGFECPEVFARPIPCLEGFYSDAVNFQYCTRCPAGSKCPTPFAKETCASGTYSVAGSVACYPIPPGMKADAGTPEGARPAWCEYDETSALAATTCT